jgi:hypothetical protein
VQKIMDTPVVRYVEEDVVGWFDLLFAPPQPQDFATCAADILLHGSTDTRAPT